MDQSDTKNKKLGKKIIVLICIMFSVLFISVGLFFQFNGNGINKKTNKSSDVKETKNSKESFEKKLKELEEKNATNEEIKKLFFENIKIEKKKINEWYYLISLTNNTPCDINQISLVWDPQKDGVSKYSSSHTVDRKTTFGYVMAGETVYEMQYFTNYDFSTDTGTPIDPDKIVLSEKSFSSYYEHSQEMENELKNIELTNYRYDDAKGIIYTISNRNEKKVYPTVNIFFYKNGEIVYVDASTQYHLEANTVLTDYEYSKSPIDGTYKLDKYNFEFDEIKVSVNYSQTQKT